MGDGRSEAKFRASNRTKANQQGQSRNRSTSQEEKPKARVTHPVTTNGAEKADNVG